MYIIPAESVATAARQVRIRLEAMTRIKASRKWWILSYTDKSDIPQSIQELISAFEATIHKQIVDTALQKGLRIVRDGLAVLWLEDSISTTNDVAALIRIPPPEVNIEILQSLSANDTWKDSIIEQHLVPQLVDKNQAATSDTAASSGSKKLATPHTGIPIDEASLRQQLSLLARTTETTHANPLTLEEGDTLVLEPENAVEVKEGGFPVMVVRYRVEQ